MIFQYWCTYTFTDDIDLPTTPEENNDNESMVDNFTSRLASDLQSSAEDIIAKHELLSDQGFIFVLFSINVF